MLRQAVNQLRGQVRVRVETSFPERVLNLCGARNLAFWDLEWESTTVFFCTLSRRDLRRLRRAVRHLDCDLQVVGKWGMPFFLGRVRKRHAMAAGLFLCGAALFFGSFFIWDITVEGNNTVSREEILRSLQTHGVGLGTFGYSLNGADLRNRVLLDIPELSWISVNVSGCRAYVQVRERIPAPELVDKREPLNIVARRSGLVRKAQALGGVACVLPGTSVEEGQLLISGVEDTGTFGARLLSGMGSVTARTWYTLTAEVPLTVEVRRPTGEEWVCHALVVGTHRIKFFRNSSIEEAEYDKITIRTPLSLFGLPLPLTWVTERYQLRETETRSRDPVAAEKAAENVLAAYLHSRVEPYGTISSTLCSSRQRGDTLVVTLTAECLEEIGTQVPIYVETANESDR